MERKMMNLGRAKKKLRYFQSEERPCHFKIKDVFSMRDLDNIFDDIDSDPGTPLLSPLPKSPGPDEQNKGSLSPVLKSTVPCRIQTSPLKDSDVLAEEADIEMGHLNDKGSPFEDIAPIKTSSPIELLAGEDVAADTEKPETSPLLFGIEDEEPVVGDLSKPETSQKSESRKDVPEGDSESLSSPPARLDFGKSTKQADPVTSSKSATEVKPSPERASTTDITTDRNGRLSLSPVVLIQKHQPDPLPEEQPNKQVQEVAVEVEVKQSLFKKKLINALQSKSSWKQETLKQPARAPSPQVQEEDFMILDDDSPIRFTITRKTKLNDKAAPEGRPVDADVKEKPSQKHTDEEEPKKKTKTKHGKTNNVTRKDTVVPSAPEQREDEVIEDVGGGEQICPGISQDADIPVTGKQRPKDKTCKADQHDGKDKTDGGAKIQSEKPTEKMKKSDKLPIDIDTERDEPESNVKAKPSKMKSAPKSSGLKAKKQDEVRRTAKNQKRTRGQQKVSEVQSDAESAPDQAEQPEVQIESPANKEPASKQRARKKPGKGKMAEKKKEVLKDQSVPDSGASTGRRRRKPPGEWWLAQNSENDTQEQQEVQSTQELKTNAKETQKKAPVLSDPNEKDSSTTSQEIRTEPATAPKLAKRVKKSQADRFQANPAGSQKNPKSAGGRRKSKSAQDHREMTPSLMVEEVRDEEEAPGQLSPLPCNRLSRQHSVTPGDKRVFDNIYTGEPQSRSAQKHPPEENVPTKRQRKQPQNWWEVPTSQKALESSPSPQRSSPQTSGPQMGPPKATTHKTDHLQKTAGRGRKKNKLHLINTPKSVKRSLAMFDAIYDSGKAGPSTEREQGAAQKGRRNLLHSLEDQSEQSSENIPNDYQQKSNSHATFDVCVSGVVPETSAAWRKTNPRASSGSRRASDYDFAYKSGPSSPIPLERYEEHEDVDLPRTTQARLTPRVLSDCELCGPPLKPIVLDNEDWDNLCVWFTHIWPTTTKDAKGVTPDDFHWHCHAGRAMGHMVDLQSNSFSSGKILLGSYMKKPAQLDLNAVTVFNVASSCVRVEIDGVKEVYNSGQTFMTPCGQSYSIHNMCQEPAVLWYHRMLPNHTRN